MEINQQNPGSLFEISGYYWKTCTLHAAVKLNLFTVIGTEDREAEFVSMKIGCNEDAVTRLLDALCAMGLLEKDGSRYRNTDTARIFLSRNSDRYVGFMIMHHHHLVESWNRLDESIRSGKPVRARASFENADERESFLLGMFNLAMGIAPKLVPTIDLEGKKHLLDLGGGPGTYAIHFAMHNPDLKATVYDLPTTRPFAENTVKKFGMENRVDFQEGDYIGMEIQGRYDAAWLSHILHGEGPEDCRRIIEKTISVLDPGGIIMIHDFFLNETKDGPLFPALFSLNMLLGTGSGRAYSEKEITDILGEFGVMEIKRLPFVGPNDSGIITGIV